MRSLNKMASLRKFITGLRRRWLIRSTGADIHPSASISLSATLIGGAPGAIRIGETTLIAFKTLLIARQPDGGIAPITVGRKCFIGGGSTIAPGVTIGDGCVIAAGSVVLSDVPARSVAGGNPARVLRQDVDVLPYGRFPSASENQGKYWQEPVKSQVRRRRVLPLLIALGVVGLGMAGTCASGEMPRWRIGGSLAADGEILPSSGRFPVLLNSRPHVIFVGDSNTAGSRIGPSYAFPALLAQSLGGRVQTTNLAHGGATVDDATLPDSSTRADLILIMLGTNDAAVRGRLARRNPIVLEDYRTRLSKIISVSSSAAKAVIVLAPPPVGSVAMARRLQPYRVASREAALAGGVRFLDPAEPLQQQVSSPPLGYDGLHLTRSGHGAVARWLAERLQAA